MWLLRLPLPPEQRIQLPPGRHLVPWYFTLEETSRFAELLTGLLAGIDRHIILPWQAAGALLSAPGPPPMAGTLLVVTFDDPSVEDTNVDEVLACAACPHAMLRIPRPREGGYAWQERYLKPPLMTLLQEHLGDEAHALASLNIASLPVRLAASMTTDALGLVELLEATVEHRLARAAEGTSAEDYEASLYAVAGSRFAERLLRLLPYRMDAAVDVLMTEGAGVWDDERFRAGAQALEDLGLAQVAGGSVSLGPLARRANDARILAVLRDVLSRRSAISPARRWVVETAPISDDLRAAHAANDLTVFAAAGVSAAAGLLRIFRDPSPAPLARRENAERVRGWVREGSDFRDRCGRARDFLSDPDRSKIVRTDRHAEQGIWVEPIKSEFTDDEWRQIEAIYQEDIEYDETAAGARQDKGSPPGSRSTFRGFKVLDRRRFSSQEHFSRQVDAFLDRRGDLKVDLARWITFAFDQDLIRGSRPLFVDLLSWIWRNVLESLPDQRGEVQDEAFGILRRCLALALKNNYTREREHIEEDARAVGLDVSAVIPAGERPSELLQKMKEGFERLLDGAPSDARKAYEQAEAIARQRGDAFDEWVAFRGEEEAAFAGLDGADWSKEETQSTLDDYQRRRAVLEQAPRVREWIEEVRLRRERVTEEVIKGLVRERRARGVSERSISFSNTPHEYWTMFRDLETIHAPPGLLRTHIQPLIDLGGFDPDEELHYRLKLGLEKAEKTREWLARITGDRHLSLEDARKRDDALLKEFKRDNTLKLERLRRVEVFPGIAETLRVDDLNWALSFLSGCQEELNDDWGAHDDYLRALCSYATLETRPIVLDRLEEYASLSVSWRDRAELARALGHRLPLERWIGLHPEAAERLVRLILDLDRSADEGKLTTSDEGLAWALFSICSAVRRFGRALPAEMAEAVRACARRLLRKIPSPEQGYLRGAFRGATRLAYVLARDDAAREYLVGEVLSARESETHGGLTLEEPLGAWFNLVDAGVSPTTIAMAEAAENLWARLDVTWDETLKFAQNNPHQAWSCVAFLAVRVAVGPKESLPMARTRALHLLHAAPEHLSLCAEVLDPALWQDMWQPLVDLVWRNLGGGDGPDPVAARLGAVKLLDRWVLRSAASPRELPPGLGFLVDWTLLALLDESVMVASHAAYAIIRYAERARSPADVRRISDAIRRIANDARPAVRGAAAYGSKKLPLMDVADEIRVVAADVERSLSEDVYAVIHRQRRFGELDGRYPPS